MCVSLKTIELEYYLNFSSALFTFIAGMLSIYFYGVYSNIFSYDQKIIPRFFRLSSGECTAIIDSSFGRLAGAPNALLGSIYLVIHTALLIASAYKIIDQIIPFSLSVASLIIGIYLIYGLIKLKIKCRICISVHIINFTVFFLQIPLITI